MFTQLRPSRRLLFLGLTTIATGLLGSATSTHAQASYTILHTFTGFPADGSNPNAGLIQGLDGTLYGTTVTGGTFDGGTVFQLAPDGSGFGVLHSFTRADGFQPRAGLIQARDGTLYGTTFGSSPPGEGVVFQLTLSPSAPKRR